MHNRKKFFFLCCIALFFTPATAADGNSLEYAVKAAYLYKFGIYVEWPPDSFASPASALNLCIVGEDPFGTTLDTAVKDQIIHGRSITIRRMKAGEREHGCHILYLGTGDALRAAQEMDAVRGRGVLTVSDIPGVGIINFVIKDKRVRFDINEDAAAQSGLGISSKLLDLALNVKPRQSGGKPVQ
jgi:hypothetical protein